MRVTNFQIKTPFRTVNLVFMTINDFGQYFGCSASFLTQVDLFRGVAFVAIIFLLMQK